MYFKYSKKCKRSGTQKYFIFKVITFCVERLKVSRKAGKGKRIRPKLLFFFIAYLTELDVGPVKNGVLMLKRKNVLDFQINI